MIPGIRKGNQKDSGPRSCGKPQELIKNDKQRKERELGVRRSTAGAGPLSLELITKGTMGGRAGDNRQQKGIVNSMEKNQFNSPSKREKSGDRSKEDKNV